MARRKRKDVLAAIRAAGYHDNQDLGIFLYLNNWVSLTSFRREFETGVALRRGGVPCDCSDCKRGKPLDSPSSGLRPPFPRPLQQPRSPRIPPGLLNQN